MKELKGQTDGYDDLTKDELFLSFGRHCYSYYDESFITRFWKIVKYLLLKPFVKGCQNCMHYRLVNGKIKKGQLPCPSFHLEDMACCILNLVRTFFNS